MAALRARQTAVLATLATASVFIVAAAAAAIA